MKVVINQSNYIPWKGYFDLIHDADLFIFLDDVQYTHRDWRSRNRIKTRHGLRWLTIPVGSARDKRINEVPLPCGDWAFRHWETLRHAYSDSPFFSLYSEFFSEVYAQPRWTTLSQFNQYMIATIAREFLNIKTPMRDSSEFDIKACKQGRILALLKAVGATEYISGPAAKAYLDPVAFHENGLILRWKDYTGYQEYLQPYPPFEHGVSILDMLFQTGPSAPNYIWGEGVASHLS